MEKVWEELKKIEEQATQIQTDAQEKSKKILFVAKQEAEKLQSQSKTYAEEEARKIFLGAVEEANQNRDKHLKENGDNIVKLQVKATKNFDKAVDTIVMSVLEEAKS